jgi:hypothetical protein
MATIQIVDIALKKRTATTKNVMRKIRLVILIKNDE